MKNNALKNLCIILLYLAAFSASLFLIFKDGVGVLKTIYSLAGLIAAYFLSALFHEGFHALSAKVLGFEVVGFSFLFFDFDKTKDKKFGLRFSPYLGETNVIPKRDGKLFEKLRFIVLSGVVGSLVCVCGLALCYFLIKSEIRFLFVFWTVSAVLFLLNALPYIIDGNDATVFLALNKKRTETENRLFTLYSLKNGKSYAEIDEKYFSENADAFILRRAFETENYALAEKIAGKEPPEIGEAEEYLERLYYYCVTDNAEGIEKYKEYAYLSDDVNEAYALRVALAYAKYRGDGKYFEALFPTALLSCGKDFLKGDGKFNETLIKKSQN